MKIIKVLIFIVFTFMLAACSKSVSSVNTLSYINEDELSFKKSSEFNFDKNYTVYDLVCIDDEIIATDSENDCLLRIN